jgi:hypothetical protein
MIELNNQKASTVQTPAEPVKSASVPNDPKKSGKKQRDLEKILLVLLFVITISQFSGWGYQATLYILSKMFDVVTASTPADLVIGIVAMISSASVFTGAALWWKNNVSAAKYFFIGSIGFMLKNVLDIGNTIWIFRITHSEVTRVDIEGLATQIGSEFFQLAFWVFIFFYFRAKFSLSDDAS